jgi:hypothetical protein
VKNLILLLAFIALFTLLTACQDEQSDGVKAYPTLPIPNVRVEQLPTATATDVPEVATPDPVVPTATIELQVQAWPTLDEEEYWLNQVDALLDELERNLNSTDTRLKP